MTALLVICAALVHAQSVTLAWEPSPDATVTGYRIYYGDASGVYTNFVDAGNATHCVVGGLAAGADYYFVATAYTASGVESLPSNEVQWTARPGSPVLAGGPWMKLTPVIERSTNRVDWQSFEGAPTWIAATNAAEFFATRELKIEKAQRVIEP
ncbi:MAG TPA: fibronectin type III domain-containing protein [Verrucomicrobiota bacterium]|nr:fibronectin type III domain-containing protein [Verrucomicrobiota bacterium]